MMEGHECKAEKFPPHPVVSEGSPEGANNHSHTATTPLLFGSYHKPGFLPNALHILSRLSHITILLGWHQITILQTKKLNLRDMKQLV